jgi:hypothetical protein
MIVSVNADVDEAERVARKRRPQRNERPDVFSVRNFQLQRMMVMTIAETPSLTASSLFVPIGFSLARRAAQPSHADKR